MWVKYERRSHLEWADHGSNDYVIRIPGVGIRIPTSFYMYIIRNTNKAILLRFYLQLLTMECWNTVDWIGVFDVDSRDLQFPRPILCTNINTSLIHKSQNTK
jgi:hypothetical protein